MAEIRGDAAVDALRRRGIQPHEAALNRPALWKNVARDLGAR